jgi:microsomal dipeptidase-like Zn-dependent dipeptidase
VIADLHAHYAMHLVPAAGGSPFELLASVKGRGRLRDRLRARLVGLAGRFANYRSFESGPRVTLPLLKQGGVGVACSVLYSFFDELDLHAPYGAPPKPGYLARLIGQLELVEEDIRERHAGEAVVVHDALGLEAAVEAGKVALVHCVEGGFHLGASADAVDRAVAELARRGVVYITLPHLFWRGVATNTPALPFLPDWLYRALFPQPAQGLSELGHAAVGAMAREGVLVDVSHMTGAAVDDTFAVLDEVDPARTVPVIASHAGVRFGGQQYMLAPATVERIAARDGVVGLILAQHQLNDGLRRRPTKTLEESLDVLWRHIDRLHEITGSHRHTAIGSDLDGFIKPTLGGLESMADMAGLERAVRGRYGDEDGELICAGNALRVLRTSLDLRRAPGALSPARTDG